MRTIALALAAATLVAGAARAQAPATLTPDLFAFPGGHVSPASAASAGLALADRWLGEEPFANPAATRPYTLALSPLLYHVSRQDLRADHRGFQETSAFFHGAGGYFGLEGGRLGISLYGYQPLVRLEDNLFVTGTQLAPGRVESNSEARELRAGLAVSYGTLHTRFGIAGEWTRREDHYERSDRTGAPTFETRTLEFSGEGVGGQAGVRLGFGEGPGAVTVGGALRYVAELDLSGDETVVTKSSASPFPTQSTTTNPVQATRAAGWEGGISASYVFTDAFQTLASVGGRGAQRYEGWGLEDGHGFEWRLAGEYHDRRDPWTVRFGVGQDQRSDVPEPRAGVVGLGFGFQLETTQIDLGVVHRSIKRDAHPASAEDRLVLSLVQRF